MRGIPDSDFQMLFESSPGLLSIVLPDSHFTLVAVNDSYLLATMTNRDAIIGKGLFDSFPDNPDDPQATGVYNIRSSLERAMVSHVTDTVPFLKYDIQKPEGGFEERYWSVANTPVLRDGQVIYLIQLTTDVTDLVNLRKRGAEQTQLTKDLQEKVIQAETEIYLRSQQIQAANEKVRKAHSELQVLYDQIKEVDRLKTQFFANVSHELRTPLTLIIGPLHRMIAQPDLTIRHREDLQGVMRNAQLLLKHVNDLLDIAKLDAKKMSPKYAAVDLTSLVKLTAGSFESLAHDRNTKFTMEFPKSFNVQIDPHMIQRVLINLISNAFKFTPTGGKIRMSVIPEQDHVQISIHDSGQGIPIHLHQLVFERFRQVEEGASRKFGGTGLGLAIVKEFVDLHHGKVRVDNSEYGGAAFFIELPLHAPVGEYVNDSYTNAENRESARPTVLELEDTKSIRPSAKPKSMSQGSILIVEDNPDMNRFLQEILEETYHVISTYNGEDGLSTALKIKPDLILTDVMMPVMSGYEMTTEIRKHPEMATTPIILLTAKADDESRVNSLRAGAQDYIVKPFSTEEVLVRVKNLIDIRRVNEKLEHENVGLYAQLKEKLLALENSNHELSRFAWAASHDLKTPLRAIDNLSKLLEKDISSISTPETKSHLEKMKRSTRRMEKLLDDILEYSMIENKLSGQWNTFVDGESLLDDISEFVDVPKGFAIEATHAFNTSSFKRMPLQQILQNLIGNAVKHRLKDHGRVEVDVRETKLQYIFSVKDDGPGIEPRYHQKIFEMFQTLKPKDQIEGSGMGLSLVKKILKTSGGTINLESDAGKGSTFFFTLPKIQTSQPNSV